VDRWPNGSPGWADGVPRALADAVDRLAAGAAPHPEDRPAPGAGGVPGGVLPASGAATEWFPGQPVGPGPGQGPGLWEVPRGLLRWGRVGCAESARVADGQADGDRLVPGFAGGPRRAVLDVHDSVRHAPAPRPPRRPPP
jgi:hypothetical protein